MSQVKKVINLGFPTTVCKLSVAISDFTGQFHTEEAL